MSIVALVGRRIDAAAAAAPRFPPGNVAIVQGRLRRELESSAARMLICSAACGADLVALAEAGDLELRRRVVLPFEAARFRSTSVVDRGESWGPLFDRILSELREIDEVITLGDSVDETDAYVRANGRILDEAQREAARTGDEAVALRMWEGQSRGEGDLTEAFGLEARRRKLRVLDVLTL